MEGCRILAVSIGLRNRAFLVGEAAAVEVAVRNQRGQIDRCGIIRNADTVSRIDGRRVSDYLVGLVAGVDELAVRAHPDMNDLVVRVIDRRHGERRNGVLAYIDAGVFCVVRREAKAPALFVDGLDGDLKNDLLAVGPAVVRADPVRGIIKARYRDGLTLGLRFVGIIVVVIAPRRRVAVSVDGGAGLGVDLNLTRAIHAFIQIKVIGDGVLEDGRFRQRDACAADLLTDRLENVCQIGAIVARHKITVNCGIGTCVEALCIGVIGRYQIHIWIDFGVYAAVKNANRINGCAAMLQIICSLNCICGNRVNKAAAMIRLTIGKHNDNFLVTICAFTKYILCSLHTIIGCR